MNDNQSILGNIGNVQIQTENKVILDNRSIAIASLIIFASAILFLVIKKYVL